MIWEALTYAAILGESIKSAHDKLKYESMDTSDGYDGMMWKFYKQFDYSILHAERGDGGGLGYFGGWCRVHGYYNTAYKYLCHGVYSAQLFSRAELSRVCFILGKYQEAYDTGLMYKDIVNWVPCLYMGLAAFKLGKRDECKNILCDLLKAPFTYDNEAKYARSFLKNEYGIDVARLQEKPKGFFARILGETPEQNSRIYEDYNSNTIDEYARKTLPEDEHFLDFNKYAVHMEGLGIPDRSTYGGMNDLAEDEYTYDLLIAINDWEKNVKNIIVERRKEVAANLKKYYNGLSNADKPRAKTECEMLFHLSFSDAGEIVEIASDLPNPCKLEEVLEFIKTNDNVQ